jgi:hypothetical protein
MSDSASDPLILQFDIRSQISNPSEAKIRAAIDQALSDAIVAARTEAQYEVKAEADVEGQFLGVGEAAVILTILHIAKVGGIAFGKGAIGAAGAAFFTAYVAPRLRALNILPGEPKEVAASTATPAPAPAQTPAPTLTTPSDAGATPIEPGDGKEK